MRSAHEPEPWTVHRAKIGGLIRRGASPDDPRVIDAQRDLRVARAEQYIRDVVESAPPLRPEDLDRLRALLPAPARKGGDQDAA